ncbi:MAG: hypothetical protein A2350_16975 [Candidatus Raymondbacteria bacterium RifOxyB12_full_50_8]|uniref:Sulfatase N-terminal domain-containing protein n=1 Tax=Candidatus Raymondbacteria bacterium RIFOXYD12_FULL_49_13 TaxID=1817890 RepID=A0A1F7FG83_UNCRA|nr:MAG: hypothetical protein A2248_11660 [Candidatus Raymondbacteria bacterium RIFOXYA2_FULL_49_16]OGJ99465.1 MAG: hypothetical protein A2350_16975 [Candidatus Raymondbacteria bacterium RifOxyB12_full_50_8]OGK05633.1 MAG: hypothetical protein A2519_07330 [Candidatus Raymondbacteria bacterium RIFOXYD12_FULL_49_13]OGP41890.1 MAG: hypothetical protein A2324_08310 [Candidatus Raymondbacteria bacterium RIFOXYB2_FULL_49_35]
MNTILFHVDQQRVDGLGCYGNTQCRTPVIDKLAAEGVRFTNAFTCSGICAPARAAFLTGKYPMKNGILVNSESGLAGGKDFTGKFIPYGTVLRDAGIEAHHIGKWHVGTSLSPFDCGFEGPFFPGYGQPEKHGDYAAYLSSHGLKAPEMKNAIYSRLKNGSAGALLAGLEDGPVESTTTYYLAERAIEALEQCAKKARQFHIRLDFWGPHLPFCIPEPYFSMYDPSSIELWPDIDDRADDKPRMVREYRNYWGVQDFTRKEWQRLQALQYGFTTFIDDQIGRVMKACDTLGLLKDTCIFCTTDHGGMDGSKGVCDKGPYMYDSIYHIPLIAWRPGRFKTGVSVENFVYHFDLMPAILDVMDAKAPDGLDAISLLPLCEGRAPLRNDDAVFCESHGHQAPYEQRMARDRDFKYIFNCVAEDEFYDLKKDQHETVNVIRSALYKDAVDRLRERLLSWMITMNDPLLRYYRRTVMN